MRTTVASAARRPAALSSASRERISAVSFQWFIPRPPDRRQRYLLRARVSTGPAGEAGPVLFQGIGRVTEEVSRETSHKVTSYEPPDGRTSPPKRTVRRYWLDWSLKLSGARVIPCVGLVAVKPQFTFSLNRTTVPALCDTSCPFPSKTRTATSFKFRSSTAACAVTDRTGLPLTVVIEVSKMPVAASALIGR